MAWSREGLLPMLGLGATLALGGCVDMFTSPPPADAVAWRGTTTAGNPAFPECGPFAFELGQYLPPTFMWDTVSGRAWPTTRSETQGSASGGEPTRECGSRATSPTPTSSSSRPRCSAVYFRRPALCRLARHHRRRPDGADRVRLTLQPRGRARPRLTGRLRQAWSRPGDGPTLRGRVYEVLEDEEWPHPASRWINRGLVA